VTQVSNSFRILSKVCVLCWHTHIGEVCQARKFTAHDFVQQQFKKKAEREATTSFPDMYGCVWRVLCAVCVTSERIRVHAHVYVSFVLTCKLRRQLSRLCSHANYEDSCKTAVSNKQQQYDYETSRNGSEAETRSETLATRLETHSGGGVVAQYSG
jgi:hypothetical protein